jgi:hypothetical protein
MILLKYREMVVQRKWLCGLAERMGQGETGAFIKARVGQEERRDGRLNRAFIFCFLQ